MRAPYQRPRRRGDWTATVAAVVASGVFLAACFTTADNTAVTRGADQLLRMTTVVDSLEHPWSVAFLPDGDYLITERPGRLRRVRDGVLDPTPLTGLPDIAAGGQGGLLDVVLDPQFADNRTIYLSYVAGNSDTGTGTEVLRATLGDRGLEDVDVIFVATPKLTGGRHFGSRLAFDAAGLLYITLGDRGQRELAQELTSHHGSVIRIHRDGSVPKDNPFVGTIGAQPEIYSYGHRNPQGLAIDPTSDRIWSHEHGPQGGDEVNVIERGANYGWPVVSHGEEYGGGEIGEGTRKDGMKDPAWVWVPSIAPSGLAINRDAGNPAADGNLLVGALKFRLVAQLGGADGRIENETRWLEDELGRVRDVRVHPNGSIYLLTDSGDGRLVRLERHASN